MLESNLQPLIFHFNKKSLIFLKKTYFTCDGNSFLDNLDKTSTISSVFNPIDNAANNEYGVSYKK